MKKGRDLNLSKTMWDFRRCCGARICRRSGAGNRCFGYIKTAYLVIGGYYSSVEYSHVGLNFETGKLYLELKWRFVRFNYLNHIFGTYGSEFIFVSIDDIFSQIEKFTRFGNKRCCRMKMESSSQIETLIRRSISGSISHRCPNPTWARQLFAEEDYNDQIGPLLSCLDCLEFEICLSFVVDSVVVPTNKKQRKGNDNMDSSGLTEEAVEKRRPKTQFAAMVALTKASAQEINGDTADFSERIKLSLRLYPSRRITYKGKGGIGKVFVGWRISGDTPETEVAAETAASMASKYLVFKDIYPHDSVTVWERATMAALSPQKLKISVVFSGGQALITLSNMDYSVSV
ncbi:unnamed protein product [Brassica napus]|uniref:(rape) hypothetical protein n=1 Tax=Brassica napus TaxID=3708 RepID=A0A816J0Y5_BRANA|nr:unnamed protein product [Brassica napus]